MKEQAPTPVDVSASELAVSAVSSATSFNSFKKRPSSLSQKWVDKGTLWGTFENAKQQEAEESKGRYSVRRLQTRLRSAVFSLIRDAKVVCAQIRARPKLLIGPFLVFALITGLGLWANNTVSERDKKNIRADAQQVANIMAENMQGQINAILKPVDSLIYAIKGNPYWPETQLAVDRVGPELINLPGVKGVLTVLNLAPNGNITRCYPLAGNENVIGRDTLNNPRYPYTLQSIKAHKPLLTGPFHFIQGYNALLGIFPIFITNLTQDTDFGITSPHTPSNCAPQYCGYNNVTKTKFWGMVGSAVNWDFFVKEFNDNFDKSSSYYFYVTDNSNNGTVLLGTKKVLQSPIVVDLTNFQLKWSLNVAPKAGWTPPYTTPLNITIPIVAVLAAVALFHMLLSRRQFKTLLQSILPKQVIQKLRHDQLFLEKYSNVTILFSDIVSYTTIAAGMEPEHVVRMLDEIFSLYDQLLEQFGVYKLDTVGDAFIAIAGCPDVDDPVKSATKMALFADAMIRMTNEMLPQSGTRIQIRVGLHSGPAVAAVLGLKVPHFSVFGDTVNVASRMESTGAASKIHASEETIKLLQQSTADFIITSRGVTAVKGKGELPTYWVEVMHDEAPAPLLPELYGRQPTNLSIVADQV